MDFDLTEDHQLIERTVRQWAAREVAPRIRELDREHRFDPRILPQMAELGLLVSRLWALRRMSSVIADALAAGESPAVEAAMVKDLGAAFERDVITSVRRFRPRGAGAGRVEELLADSVHDAPTFTLRGGTPEILRGVVARDLGVR